MPLKWGILTAGRIAHAFASGLQASRTGQLVATGARDLARAEEFAEKWGGRGYGSYQEVLDDPDVEAVYIATPHHLHAEWTIAAARAAKAILCEKPFTLDHADAAAAIDVVKKAGVFFMEAFMYRCLPQMRKVAEVLENNALGMVRAVSAEFSYDSNPANTNFRNDAAVGGGGIMDVGTYCTSFALLVANEAPSRVEYVASLDRVYDSYGTGILQFPNGIVANIASGMHLQMRNDATIYGEAGSLHIEDPWKCPVGTKLTLNRYGKDAVVFHLGCDTAALYAYEADAVGDYITEDECPLMSIEHTLINMAILDRLRTSCGMNS